MEYFLGIKNKEIYEEYYDKLENWHLDILSEFDIDKIKNLTTSCKNTIILTNESKYKGLLDSLKNGNIERLDLNMFLFKLEYYMTKIRDLRLELGWHVVSFNEGYKDIKTLRDDFRQIYTYISTKKEIKPLYALFHKKYKYILEGCTSDLMTIKSIKQAKHIKVYIELLWLSEEVNKLWKSNINKLKLDKVFFNAENILLELENITEKLHKIEQLYIIYNKSILRLLKRNTCFQALNPYDESTYDKINDVISYIYNYNEYIIKKTFLENENNIKKTAYKVL